MRWGHINILAPVHVKALYWLPDKRWWPDLIGLLQGSADLLEKAGIIENDRQIESWDGSRIMGIDKNAPRAELTITEITPCEATRRPRTNDNLKSDESKG
jgi:Holliday junction resolvase RusA-like endonuclease